MDERIKQYLINKYMGAGTIPVYNIKYELEDGYEFGMTTVFGKEGLTIKKKK